jgi:exonuclease III
MSRIDHVFCSTEWQDLFPNSDLQALASMTSDHAPLLLQGDCYLGFLQGFSF